jgi:hypothetical protein
LWLATALAVFLVGTSGVYADTQTQRDPEDSAGRLDVKVIRHSHTQDGRFLKHVVVTREGWSERAFRRKGLIYFVFSWRGNNCAESEVIVDTKDGGLRARWHGYDPLGCGKGDDAGGYGEFHGNVKVRKPTSNRLILLVPRKLFPNRMDRYQWSVTTTWVCDNPCGDNAPDRENSDRALVRHDL